jgi:hypothetical protein
MASGAFREGMKRSAAADDLGGFKQYVEDKR